MTEPEDAEARWRALAQSETRGRFVDKARTPAGLEVKTLYTARDLEGVAHLDSIPGEAPFVRGVRATMYATRPWTLRQYAGFSTPEETNAFFRRALQAGQRGLSVAFDLPTHRGYDSDDPRVKGDVGKAGVAVSSVEDMKLVFDGIPLGEVSVSMTMNGAVLPVLAAFIVTAEEQGVGLEQLSGTIQNDILKEFMVRNTFIYPPEPSMRIVADVMELVSQKLPRYNSISISGYHLQEAGASAELELGYTLADGLAYASAGVARGLDADAVLGTLSFFFGIGLDFFGEIAKLRAARLLWAELVQERFAPKNPRSLALRTHCQTSGVSLTAQDPLNNVVRTTLEALSAVLGGTQSLHTNSFDEALALPSERSARVARNTQLILQHETGIPKVVDPLAGSYYVERLTHELAAAARQLVLEVEAHGGMTRAIEQRIPQRRIAQAAAERQARIDRGEELVIGVNAFRVPDEPEPELLVVDTARVLEAQSARLARVRKNRDENRVQSLLASLEAGARGNENLLTLSIEAMRARATVGEVSLSLERVFGRHNEVAMATTGVFSKAYAGDAEWSSVVELLRRVSEREGRQPRILIAKLGQDGHDRGAKVVAAGLSDLGFDVELGPLFQSPEQAARHALESDVHFVGVSTQAGAHLVLVPELLDELRKLGADGVKVVVGGIISAPDRAALEARGVSAVFGPGAPILEIARQLLELLDGVQPTGSA